MSTLYLVATPIGNLKDITLRALETLKEVDLVLAEDTRRTRQLLSHYNISKPIESFHEHSEESKIPTVLEKLNAGVEIALVSDAGTPTISDPGFKLVRECLKNNIKVEPIPGPSAILTSLIASGLPTDSFLFLGYLPKKRGKQDAMLDFLELVWSKRAVTVIFFESPYRIKKTLTDFARRFPQRELVVGRELTKVHEEFIRGKVMEVASKEFPTKGEFTILLH
ncbi:MAG: 16S rRNA (cytidine(1402)-2'-O)-methyltransferase [Candidatus Woykebacteria bacterium GWB1_45_5]|uniref:Ribosomal RNA small subunit methyltransferase I n=2 Tax=Candidatus Woykeibacteriota TaxID=1817899 RepID=A0A1G1W0L5_9BACT|nr:MAG: 16S rRNA (cytidine(1402)-2'-O)-methyltransferase [Candidatus Woykebacteria bacterium GWA1_44_8]OGY24709.1 MAG: 16S rRNA (cytidine(1402)-2'-O)-methyltransferase [Candidatus Woykebacteria bacterium GWB1_45_5]